MARISQELNFPGSTSTQLDMHYKFRLALLNFDLYRFKQLGFSLAPVLESLTLGSARFAEYFKGASGNLTVDLVCHVIRRAGQKVA